MLVREAVVLADQTGPVAALAQELEQVGLSGLEEDRVLHGAGEVGPASGPQRDAGRDADGTGREAVAVGDAALGEGFDVRRSYGGVSVEAERGCTELIAHDHQDVGRLGGHAPTVP